MKHTIKSDRDHKSDEISFHFTTMDFENTDTKSSTCNSQMPDKNRGKHGDARDENKKEDIPDATRSIINALSKDLWNLCFSVIIRHLRLVCLGSIGEVLVRDGQILMVWTDRNRGSDDSK